ncbi:DUF1127 domain-containing protein [uncultured Ferrovibrio sp.]|uniref:DUF1127 domain-containing protein n=1 Tax=uncultured Ferrovibrio sp. TaxID=1576913 RepID=UPI00262080E4|nr:DUF1127 domain-containing protein [uncultured Ferrovibrio sp.]
MPAAEPAPDPGQTDWLAGTRNPAVFDGLGGPSWWLFLRAAATLLATWRRRIAARRELAQLDIHSLRDAGIDPSIAAFEAAQPFWKPQISLRPIDDDR